MNVPAAVPSQFGSYRTRGIVGSGGVAYVSEAIDERSGRRVAIKSLLPQYQEQPLVVARFEREARIVARLRHPSVVSSCDVGSEDGRPYLVMEFLDGETLAARLARSGRLTLEEVAEVLVPVCSGVAAAHAAGVIHRDLKPSNIMLAIGPRGIVPKVLDFGVSKIEGAFEPKLTVSGTVLGTMRYLSPEQAFGRDVTPASDVYAIGLMLFECATGKGPFGTSGFDAVQALLAQQDAPAPSAVLAELPPEFDRVVGRALAREPGERFASPLELARALIPFLPEGRRRGWERVLEAEERGWWGTERVSSVPPPPSVVAGKERGRRGPRWWAVALAVAAVIGAAGAG
ncbi:MAG TPA: serine/threonine-protein kinase, partial [Polyangiaceae bacterium]